MSTTPTHDVFKRAFRTFVQAFTAQAAVLIPAVDASAGQKAYFAVATSAGAAGISAVWNAFVAPWLESRKVGE